MTKIYLVRHGQSDGNDKQIFLGRIDNGLSELGKLQAESVGEYLSSKNISRVYSSSLQRAMLTALPLARRIGVEVIANDGIREIDAGKWQGCTYDEISQKFPDSHKIWISDIGNAVCDGGECIAELQKRALKAFGEICKQNDNREIAVVSHGACIRSMMTHFYGKTLSEMKNIPWMMNAAVTVINFDNGKYEVEDFNYIGHLDGLVSKFPSNV